VPYFFRENFSSRPAQKKSVKERISHGSPLDAFAKIIT
jgi:hypothetical protein